MPTTSSYLDQFRAEPQAEKNKLGDTSSNLSKSQAKCYCNFCSNLFEKFDIFNGRVAKCPKCGSLERHRHLYMHLAPLMQFIKSKKILIMTSEKIIKNAFAEGSASFIDIIKDAHQKNVMQISFEDKSFDYIICSNMLERITDDLQAMRELCRVLKHGGIAFLEVPLSATAFEDDSIVSPELRAKHFGHKDHVRKYSLALFLSRLQSAGFDTIDISEPSSFKPRIKSEMNTDMQLGKNQIMLARKIASSE